MNKTINNKFNGTLNDQQMYPSKVIGWKVYTLLDLNQPIKKLIKVPLFLEPRNLRACI